MTVDILYYLKIVILLSLLIKYIKFLIFSKDINEAF